MNEVLELLANHAREETLKLVKALEQRKEDMSLYEKMMANKLIAAVHEKLGS